jgi:endonuclease III
MISAPRGKESGQKKKVRAQKIETLLRKKYPSPTIALSHSNPFQLLIAVILSAQCTDVRVNMVTPSLFTKYKTARDFAEADPAELEREIHSTGFFRNKSKSIIGCCRALVENHKGSVPSSMEELIQLPGVGRKTANCILGGAFGIPAGIVVDTHVIRLATRLGLTQNSQPDKIESDLCELLARKDWIHFGNAVIHHGRSICSARNPRCAECILNKLCPSAEYPQK